MGFWDKVKDAAGADKRRSAAEQISQEREVEETRESTESAEPAQERASIPADPQIAGGEPEPAAGPDPVPTDDTANHHQAGPAQREAQANSDKAPAEDPDRDPADHHPATGGTEGSGTGSDEASGSTGREHQTYTVRNGDTLSEIGQRFGVGAGAIAELNGIENPDLIYPGQVFKIPAS